MPCKKFTHPAGSPNVSLVNAMIVPGASFRCGFVFFDQYRLLMIEQIPQLENETDARACSVQLFYTLNFANIEKITSKFLKLVYFLSGRVKHSDYIPIRSFKYSPEYLEILMRLDHVASLRLPPGSCDHTIVLRIPCLPTDPFDMFNYCQIRKSGYSLSMIVNPLPNPNVSSGSR
jgi:hypothetical protein